jgi:hypothetical protein
LSHEATAIPRLFTPTHETAGLPGYPAIDVFGPRDHAVRLLDRGRVRRISGKSPCRGGAPGGPAGWSLYIAADSGDDWYLTHFGALLVRVGDRITESTFLGTPLDARDAPGWSTEHIHAGCKRTSGSSVEVAAIPA